MDSFFGTSWSDLTLDDVEAFFADAGDEGLTWEAKGTERPRRESVRKHVGAFANTEGGFYIVGAIRANGAWRIDPIDFGRDEPATWLSQLIRSNLRPVPRFDVKVFERHGLHIVVVNVDMAAEPPCVTINGEVFARVSGESYPVKDPETLRRLFDLGKARAAAAEAEALFAAELPLTEADLDPENPYLRLRLAFAPTGRLDDVGARLFTRSYFEKLVEGADQLPAAPLYPYPRYQSFSYGTTQESVLLRERHAENRQRWTLQARWNGSVAAYLDIRPDPDDGARLVDTAIFGEAIWPASTILARLVRELGGYGRTHVAFVVHARRFQVASINGNTGNIPGPSTMRPIQAWTNPDGDLSEHDIDRMRREPCRASGAVVWEPEPEGEPPGE